MKKNIALLLSLVVMTATAADLTPLTRLLLERNAEKAARRVPRESTTFYEPLILQIDEKSDVLDRLTELGTIIYNQRGDLVLTSIPLEHLNEALDLEGILHGGSSGDMSACLDMARPMANVDIVHAGGGGLGYPYTGRGVITGFCDTGFDPNHIAFGDRVVALYHFHPTSGLIRKAETPAEISEWGTDDSMETHATHVANIMAGGYKLNPYYGVATEAEIVGTTSDLSDVGILAGAEEIIAYAKKEGKRAVINMSLSNYTGPHDGTDLMCQYLSRLSDDAVICMSSGNTGKKTIPIVATQEITEAHPYASVRLTSQKDWLALDVEGYTDIWCNDGTPMHIRFEVYDSQTAKIVYSTPWYGGAASGHSFEYTLNDDIDTSWGKYFGGYIKVIGEISPLNGRYNITASYTTSTTEKAQGLLSARYYNVLVVKTDPGHRVDLYADGVYSYFHSIAGNSTYIGPDGSISNMATAEGVIPVGACTSRSTYPLVDSDEDATNGYTAGTVSDYTSFSSGITTSKTYPLVCAPGTSIVSALNSGDSREIANPANLSYVENVNGKNYYWGAEKGTSMASPFVAGVIALWLEAKPDLNKDQLYSLLKETSNRNFSDIDDPRWGYGCVDALAGLQKLTSSTYLSIADGSNVSVTVDSDRRVSVTDDEGNPLPFSLYTLSGTTLDSHASLTPGIYLVNVDNAGATKIVVR